MRSVVIILLSPCFHNSLSLLTIPKDLTVQAFPGILVNYGQNLELAISLSPVLNKVLAPDMVGVLCFVYYLAYGLHPAPPNTFLFSPLLPPVVILQESRLQSGLISGGQVTIIHAVDKVMVLS